MKEAGSNKDGVPSAKGRRGRDDDLQHLVRSEVHRIMEAQHQSMMSMLETSGTLMLRELEQTGDSHPHGIVQSEQQQQQQQTSGNPSDVTSDPHSAKQEETSSHLKRVHSGLREETMQENGQIGRSVPRADGARNMTDRKAGGMRLDECEHDGKVVSLTHVHSAELPVHGNAGSTVPHIHDHVRNEVPALRLEDLTSAQDPPHNAQQLVGDHQRGRAMDIPGMIRGFPLLSVPRREEPYTYRNEAVPSQDASGASEYDMIPTRDGDVDIGGQIPGRQDLVLLRLEPDNPQRQIQDAQRPFQDVGRSHLNNHAAPAAAEGSSGNPAFSSGAPNFQGPSVLHPVGRQNMPSISGMPLLRIPQKTQEPQLFAHTNQERTGQPMTYLHKNSERNNHFPNGNFNLQGRVPFYGVGQNAPPGHTPREAWGNPAMGGGGMANVAHPFPGKVDIPLLRIVDGPQMLPAAGPQYMTHPQRDVGVLSDQRPIHLPLLRLKDPEPPSPLIRAPLMRPSQHPFLPFVTQDEILAFEQEKRKREIERDLELRRRAGAGPIQLLRLEPEQRMDPRPEPGQEHRAEPVPGPRTGTPSSARQKRRNEMTARAERHQAESNKENLPKGIAKKSPRATVPSSDSSSERIAERASRRKGKRIRVQAVESCDREKEEKEEIKPGAESRKFRDRRKKDQDLGSRKGDGVASQQQSSAGRSEVDLATHSTKQPSVPVHTRPTSDEGDYDEEPVHDYISGEEERTPVPSRHDVETQVADLGQGYAIKPGTHDGLLSDPDARPLLPTSAQIHYETVMKLQQPPPVVRPREAEMQTKVMHDAATLTEGILDMGRLRENMQQQQKESKPTMDEAEEQYTSAVTGLNKAGNIIAPDIFFGLRFRSGQPSTSSQAGLQGVQGREFINVADINAEDVFRDIPQQTHSKQHQDPSSHRGDASDERDAKRRKENEKSEDNEEEGEEERRTIADLHYRSLFHRDAVPSDGLALLEEEEMDGARRRKQIGDEVTRKLLEAKLEKAERGFTAGSSLTESRGQSRDRIKNQLSRMGERLDAIGEVSNSMQRDFSNTRLLLHTVENLSEAMTASQAGARPRPDYSLQGYRDAASARSDGNAHPTEDAEMKDGGNERKMMEEKREDGERMMDGRKKEERMTEKKKEEVRKDKSGKDDGEREREVDEEVQEDEGRITDKDGREDDSEVGEDDDLDPERANVTEGNLTLGISGISGVSDIIAEVIADDDVHAGELGLTEAQRRAAKKRVQHRREEELDMDALDGIPLTSLTDRQLRLIFSPRSGAGSPSPERDPAKAVPFAAKPAQRSTEERQRIKEWMEQRRAQKMGEYKKKREARIEAEHKPFKSAAASALKQVPTTTKQIKKAEDEKKRKKEIKQKEHHDDRLAEAKNLIAELLDDHPELPEQFSTPQRRQKTSDPQRRQKTTKDTILLTNRTGKQEKPPMESSVLQPPMSRTHQESGRKPPRAPGGASSRMGATRVLEDRNASGIAGGRDIRMSAAQNERRSTVPKGTYMFIDSGAYKVPPPGQRGILDTPESRGRVGEDRRGRSILRDQASSSFGERPPPVRRTLQSSLERSVQFEDQRRSSEDDLQLVLEEMSDLVERHSSDESEKENASKQSDEMRVTYKPKSYKDMVKLQRPEVTRKQTASPRRPKTYVELLQDMKADVGSVTQPSSSGVKAKQRLYGSTRLPGWNKDRKHYTNKPRTYTERLSEMRPESRTDGQRTRLVPRSRPRTSHGPVSSNQQLLTGTMTLAPNRHRDVERRGLTPEPGPRSSTPYTAMLAELSNRGTHRDYEPVVSPRPNPGMRTKPRAHEPVAYVDQLKRNAAEAAASAPPKKYRTVYAPKQIPAGTYTYSQKSPGLHTPSPRHRPYETGPRRPVGAADDVSDISELSPWSVSDDVRKILDNDSELDEGLSTIREPRYEYDDEGDEEYGDYAAAVDIHDLEDKYSISSGSIMSNIDWDAVDKMIETVK